VEAESLISLLVHFCFKLYYEEYLIVSEKYWLSNVCERFDTVSHFVKVFVDCKRHGLCFGCSNLLTPVIKHRSSNIYLVYVRFDDFDLSDQLGCRNENCAVCKRDESFDFT
jgi:hypothetical protein